MAKIYDAEKKEAKAKKNYEAEIAQIRAENELFGDLDLPLKPMEVYYPKPHTCHGSLHFNPEHHQETYDPAVHLAPLVAALPPMPLIACYKTYSGFFPPESAALMKEEHRRDYGVDEGKPIVPLLLEINLAHFGNDHKITWFTKPKDKIIEVHLKVPWPRGMDFSGAGGARFVNGIHRTWSMRGGIVNRWESRGGGGYCEGSSRYTVFNTHVGGDAAEWVKDIIDNFFKRNFGA